MQYVGEYSVKLSRRFGTHRACMKGKEYTSSCKRLGDHFSSGPCKGSEHFVQVVEKMSGDGHLGNGEIDRGVTKERRRREDQWMLKLRTVYPYGLNDSLNESRSS